MNVTLPNGRVINGVPEGTTKAQIQAKAIASGMAVESDFPQAEPVQEQSYNPTDDMSGFQKFAAGVGGGVTDLGYGAGQLLGMVSQDEVAEKARLDESLNATGAGMAGNITGKIAAALPTAFVPGANSLVGASLVGGGLGALEPVSEGNVLEGKLKNTLGGAAFGAAGQKAGQLIGGRAQGRLDNALDKLNRTKADRSVMDSSLRGGLDMGMTIPPSQANPSFANQMLEGLSGKIKTAQRAGEKNQSVMNAAARRELGLDEGAALNDDTFNSIRSAAGEAYEAVKSIGQPIRADQKYFDALTDLTAANQRLAQDFPELADSGLQEFAESISKDQFGADNAIEAIKQFRHEANTLFRSANPADLAMARAKKKAATAMEDLVGRNLKEIGADDLYDGFVQGRQLIAKTYSVEEAVNKGSGNVIGSKLAGQFKKGKPLSGDLKKVAQFASAFPRATQEITSSMPALSPLDYAAAVGGTAATGSPLGMLGLAARPAARELITSAPYQNLMTQPNYAPSLLTKAAAISNDPAIQKLSPLLGASVYTSQQ